MDLNEQASKQLTKFEATLKELTEENCLMDEDQLIDFIDDWSNTAYENDIEHWQIALSCRFSENQRYQEAWETALQLHDLQDGTDLLMAACAKWFVHFVLVDEFGGYEIAPD